MKRDFLQNSIFYVLTLLIAFGLKYHYSRASSEDLIWILGPTARVVEHISGIPFEKESGTGYINPDYRIIIAASCAGVNFLIAAFCMAMYSCIHQIECHRLKFLWLVISFMSAYLVTLAANALRIIFAIVFYQTELTFIWFTSEQIHRLEGILRQVARRPIITLGDTEQYARRGCVANLYLEGDRVRFRVNVDAVKRSGLRISARLLRLADIVNDPVIDASHE